MTKPSSNATSDFKNGISISKLPDGKMLSGKLDGEEVLLVHKGKKFFAVGAHCTHYGGTLADGLIVGDTVRCPLHHACFSLRSGEALRPPALDPIPCWKVERVGNKILVRERLSPAGPQPIAGSAKAQKTPESVVIIGGGAAGLAAADMLRREGYDRPVTIFSADDSPPCDRPNLSKDFLAGTAQEEWIPLRPPEYYTDRKINLVLDSRVAAIDVKEKQLHLQNGKTSEFGARAIGGWGTLIFSRLHS